MSGINRRKFFTGVSAGMAAALLGKHSNAAFTQESSSATPGEETREIKIRKYNPLGNTKIKTSDVIFGAGNVFSPNVIKYAYDLGITLFDTAENYMQGRSEEYVGTALKGVRKKASIITKHIYRPGTEITKESIIERMNASLKRLQTDYVDIAFLHSIDNLDLLENETIRSTYAALVKEGKVRFTGFSTHNAGVTLKECVKPEYADFVKAVLFMYNHMEGKEIEPLIAKLHAKGIGTIAMKTAAGGRHENLKAFLTKDVSYPQVAMRWVLANKDIDCAVVSMGSFMHVEDFVAGSGKPLKRKDLALLEKYRKEVDDNYCRLTCNRCEASCPQSVAVSDVMRYLMYFEDYNHQAKAIQHYAALDLKKKPLDCSTCAGYCTTACPFGLPVQQKLIHSHDVLTV